MNLRPLIISDGVMADVKRLIEFADMRRISIHDEWKVMSGELAPPGDDPNRTCVIPIGYRCVFTIEEQPTVGLCRHLSISVLGDGWGPAKEAVIEIGKLFGIDNPDALWIEHLDDAHKKGAINVLKKMESNETKTEAKN